VCPHHGGCAALLAVGQLCSVRMNALSFLGTAVVAEGQLFPLKSHDKAGVGGRREEKERRESLPEKR